MGAPIAARIAPAWAATRFQHVTIAGPVITAAETHIRHRSGMMTRKEVREMQKALCKELNDTFKHYRLENNGL